MTPERIKEIIVEYHNSYTRGLDKNKPNHIHRWGGEPHGWAMLAAKKIHEEHILQIQSLIKKLTSLQTGLTVDSEYDESVGDVIRIIRLYLDIDSLSQPSALSADISAEGTIQRGDAGELKTEKSMDGTFASPKDAPFGDRVQYIKKGEMKDAFPGFAPERVSCTCDLRCPNTDRWITKCTCSCHKERWDAPGHDIKGEE